MIIDETTEPSAAPFSQPTIDELRAVANAQTSPARRQLLNLLIDIQQAERDAHDAQVNGDSEAETMAIFARCKAKGELDEYYDELADVHNTGFTWALRRTPQVLGPLIQSALGIDLNKMRVGIAKNSADIAKNSADIAKNSADIAKNSADIVELADEVVRLKGGAV